MAAQGMRTLPIWNIIIFLVRFFSIAATFILCFGLTLAFVFKLYPWTVGNVVFMSHIHFPPYRNFSDLESFDLIGENIYFKSSSSNITLGAWRLDNDMASSKLPGNPVVLYIHGAQGSRAGYHRTQMYWRLQQLGFPVVTFDYRGYGDSSGVPTSELDLLEDSMTAYDWTRQEYPLRPLLLWGHSLGTGVSVRLVQTLERQASGDQSINTHQSKKQGDLPIQTADAKKEALLNQQPANPEQKVKLGALRSHPFNVQQSTNQGLVSGLILDSPYSSIFDVLRGSPLLWLFHQVPAFTKILLEALEAADVTLNSSDRIRTTEVPLLILHTEDDWVIPVSLGRHLFEVGKQRGAHVITEYVEYSATLSYGHRGVYHDPKLPEIVADFVSRALMWRNQPENVEKYVT